MNQFAPKTQSEELAAEVGADLLSPPIIVSLPVGKRVFMSLQVFWRCIAFAFFATAAHADGPVMLTLHGYNYTNRYIDSYSINGQGGGLRLSTPTAGGSKSTCCASWWPGSRLPIKVRIKWVADYCEFRDVTSTGEVGSSFRKFWKEAEVLITTPPPADAKYIEAHIYQDGHVEAAITNTYSPPRLILPFDEETHSRPGDPDIAKWCTAAQLVDPNGYPSLSPKELKDSGVMP